MSDSFPKSIELKKTSLHERIIVAKVLLESVLDELPSVQPRKGKWLRSGSDLFPYECDQCGDTNERTTPWCPHCGCRMEEGDAE